MGIRDKKWKSGMMEQNGKEEKDEWKLQISNNKKQTMSNNKKTIKKMHTWIVWDLGFGFCVLFGI